MIAVARYTLADYLRSHRFLPPLVAYAGFLGVIGEGPVLSAYGASSAALLPVSVWLTVSLHNAEDPLQHMITLANAGGRSRVAVGKVCAALVLLLVFIALALVRPMVVNGALCAPGDVAAGFAAHLGCGLTGIALGSVCVHPVIKRQGYAFAAALLLSLVALVSRYPTPANETIRLLSAAPPRPPAGELALLAALSVPLLAALASLSSWVAHRRR